MSHTQDLVWPKVLPGLIALDLTLTSIGMYILKYADPVPKVCFCLWLPWLMLLLRFFQLLKHIRQFFWPTIGSSLLVFSFELSDTIVGIIFTMCWIFCLRKPARSYARVSRDSDLAIV